MIRGGRKYRIAHVSLILLCIATSRSFAADINIDVPTYLSQSISENNQTININPSAYLELTSGYAISVPSSYSNWRINVDSEISDKGISSASSAIYISGTSSTVTGYINLESGAVTTSNDYTIRIFARTSTQIDIAQAATISNSSTTSKYVIFSVLGSLNINNAGKIEGPRGISISSYEASNITNSGTIKATDNAINCAICFGSVTSLVSTAVNTVDNQGLIFGDISINHLNLSLTNSGSIFGNINTLDIGTEISGDIDINNSGSIAGNINLGSNSSSSLTMNSGSIIGNVYTENSDQKIYLNAGSFAGNISLTSGVTADFAAINFEGNVDGLSDNAGTINLKDNFTLNSSSSFGATNKVNSVTTTSDKTVNFNGSVNTENLTVAFGSTLNIGHDISATNTGILGTVNFGNVARRFTGDINVANIGKLNLGTAAHNIDGNLTLDSGSTLEAGINSALITSGAAIINSGVKLNIDLKSNYSYLADGAQYTIVDGNSGSAITAIDSSNININGSGSNKFNILTFNTSVSGDDLLVTVARKKDASVTSTPSAKSIYNAVNDAGSFATGELKLFQQYLDNISDHADLDSALKSANLQNVNSVLITSSKTVNESIVAVENRLEASRYKFDEVSLASSQHLRFKNKLAPLQLQQTNNNNAAFSQKYAASKVNTSIILQELYKQFKLYDEISDNGVWVQAFGSNARQGDLGNDDGYKSKSLGFAFGYDKKLTENTRIGLSLSYANSDSKSLNNNKITGIDTYQVNLYSGYVFNRYFLDMIAGFAWNQYDSSRLISSIDRVAKGSYNGQTYIAKIKGGFSQDLGNNFSFIPEVSASYNHNIAGKYTENNAGTASQNIEKNSSDFLEGRVGINVSYETITKNGNLLMPKLGLSYGYNFLSKYQTIVSNFVGQTATITSTSSKLSPASFRLGSSLDIYNKDFSVITLEYGREIRHKYISNYGMIRVRWEFETVR